MGHVGCVSNDQMAVTHASVREWGGARLVHIEALGLATCMLTMLLLTIPVACRNLRFVIRETAAHIYEVYSK